MAGEGITGDKLLGIENGHPHAHRSDTIDSVLKCYPQSINRVIGMVIAPQITDPGGRAAQITRLERICAQFFDPILLSGSICPRIASALLQAGLFTNSDFQKILMEVVTYSILNGNFPDDCFLLMIENPKVFTDTISIRNNREIQQKLRERLIILKSSGQHFIAERVESVFLNLDFS